MSLFARALRFGRRKMGSLLEFVDAPSHRSGNGGGNGGLASSTLEGGLTDHTYGDLYERHSQALPPDASIGDGDFALIGRIELAILLAEGLADTSSLIDFGCGTGRLAVHAIPRLTHGQYIGTDIANGMLTVARDEIARRFPSATCRVSWIKQPPDVFVQKSGTADMICAFSVFTHMEHEDSFRYLKDAHRVVRPGGKFVFSCLPMSLKPAQEIFLEQASHPFAQRWLNVRNITTTIEMMEILARLAGWTVKTWYPGDHACIPMPDSTEKRALGQSTCILVRN